MIFYVPPIFFVMSSSFLVEDKISSHLFYRNCIWIDLLFPNTTIIIIIIYYLYQKNPLTMYISVCMNM
jgi:hypothetical protein